MQIPIFLFQKFVFCEIKVISVEENHSWWHYSCGTCESEIEKKESNIYCNTCKNPIPVAEKRFILILPIFYYTDVVYNISMLA